MTIIGITGPTGAGKTTALSALSDMGALVLDCDAVYHEMLNDGGDMVNDIKARFSEAFDGDILNRKKLGASVFGNPQALSELSHMTHVHVRREVLKRIADFKEKGGTIAAIDAIGLPEGELIPHCTHTVAVTAPRDVRIQRIMAREGISEEYAKKRVSAQHNDEYFINACTYSLYNDCETRQEFYNKCKHFFEDLIGGNL